MPSTFCRIVSSDPICVAEMDMLCQGSLPYPMLHSALREWQSFPQTRLRGMARQSWQCVQKTFTVAFFLHLFIAWRLLSLQNLLLLRWVKLPPCSAICHNPTSLLNRPSFSRQPSPFSPNLLFVHMSVLSSFPCYPYSGFWEPNHEEHSKIYLLML